MKNNLEIIRNAYENGYAIPQFNINNCSNAKLILEQCEIERSAVIIGVSEGAADYIGGYNVIRGFIDGLIKDLNITIPVILHLDHGKSVEAVRKACDANFDSIMIDASKNDIETNIKITNEASKIAGNRIVEAEIGQINTNNTETKYTSSSEALYFSDHVNIDMLAPAVGSVHGLYKGEPNIQFDIINDISKTIDKPIVLHGGTGLGEEILKKSIAAGVAKINFNTELQVAWHTAVKIFIEENPDQYDPRKVIGSGDESIKEAISKNIKICGSNNRY